MKSYIEENSPHEALELAEKMLKQGKIKSYGQVNEFLHHRGRRRIDNQKVGIQTNRNFSF